MYKAAYAEILADRSEIVRGDESDAIEASIRLLEQAAAKGASSPEWNEALQKTAALWDLLVQDLCSDDNSLPDETRASLVNIGLFVDSEIRRISIEGKGNLRQIIEISESVLDGLRSSPRP